MATQQIAKVNGTVREEFGATEIAPIHETASTAVAAREKAAVEARYIVARNFRRNMEDVRVRLLKECDRPGFAEVARFKKPLGKKLVGKEWVQQYAEGPSIRFVEAGLRMMGNIYVDPAVVFENDDQRIVRISVTDLESNTTYGGEVVIKKVVERKKLKEDQESIYSRTNSYGDTVYGVQATEDEANLKQNSNSSKIIRNSGLRLLPGDVVEECMAKCLVTQAKQDKADPDAAKRKLIDSFNALGVGPIDLQEYLGHSLDRVQPAELTDLRATYTAIKEGETTWQAIMDSREPKGSVEAAQQVAKEKIEKAGGKYVAPDQEPIPEAKAEEQKQDGGEFDSGPPIGPDGQPDTPKAKLKFGAKPQ